MSAASPAWRAAPPEGDGSSRVRVVARFRPPVADEADDECVFAVSPDSRRVTTTDQRFTFELDAVFGEDTSQDEVFSSLGAPSLEDVLSGYNATVLTYGHTGSGKSYCMFGPRGADESLLGLAPRAANYIFARFEQETSANSDCTVRCAFLENHCERLRDLLNPSNQGLRVRETPLHGPVVEGLTHEPVRSAAEAMELLSVGTQHRAVAPTLANQHSSRSHAIFYLDVHRRAPFGGSPYVGRLTLVDLAGSERVSWSRPVGEMLEEAKTINKSLLTLGKVIDALADQRPHVPYRDSVLTRLLEDSLGGNCRTTLLVAGSTASRHSEMTLSSLRFATRTQQVRTQARVNYTYSPEELPPLVERLQRELASLRTSLACGGLQHGISWAPDLEQPWDGAQHGIATWSSGQASDERSRTGSACDSLHSTASHCSQGDAVHDEKFQAEDGSHMSWTEDADVNDIADASIADLEEALLAQERALDEVRARGAASEAAECKPSMALLQARWQALFAEVDGWGLKWRLRREQHRSEALALEVGWRARRVEDLEGRFRASQRRLAEASRSPNVESLPSCAAPRPAGGSSFSEGRAEFLSPSLPRISVVVGGRSRPARGLGALPADRQGAAARSAQRELGRRDAQLAAMTRRLASADLEAGVLRHALRLKELEVQRARQEAWQAQDASEGELWRLLHRTAQVLSAGLQDGPDGP